MANTGQYEGITFEDEEKRDGKLQYGDESS